MQLNSTIRPVALTLLLAALLIGIIHLFILRFQAGDMYPAYSSLRSDPLGTKALYESLARFDHITLQRNYHMLSSLKFEPDTTLFYIGAQAAEDELISQALSEVFDRLTQSGGRLVIAFMPVNKKTGRQPGEGPEAADECKNDGPVENNSEDQKPASGEQSEIHPPSDPGEEKDLAGDREWPPKKWVSLKQHWGIGFALNEDLPVKDDKFLAIDAVSRLPNLPGAVSWHTNLYFEIFDDSWQTLYAVAGNPVVVERAMAGGTIVLCADSFFTSNEALRSERHPQLLVWLIGRHANIVFDESHLGIYRHPGVFGLLRHYRFHWVLAAMVVVALLFVWNRAVYFVPPRKEELPAGVDIISEKNDSRGLFALLRRNIAGHKILQICGQEWERTFRKDKRIQPGAFEQVRTILQMESQTSLKKADSVKGYRKISRIISEDKGYE